MYYIVDIELARIIQPGFRVESEAVDAARLRNEKTAVIGINDTISKVILDDGTSVTIERRE